MNKSKHQALPFLLSRLELSGVTLEQATKGGIRPATREEALKLYPKLPAAGVAPLGFLIPYPGEKKDGVRFRNDLSSRSGFDKATKGNRYAQPAGTGCLIYFPEVEGVDWTAILADPTQRVHITEGELKALKATLSGIPTIGIGGVSSFVENGQLHPKLRQFCEGNRIIIAVFDSDAEDKYQVRVALNHLLLALASAGADPYVRRLPSIDDPVCSTKTGLDDFLRVEGAEAFEELSLESFKLSKELHRLNMEYAFCETPLSVIRIPRDRQEIKQWKPGDFVKWIEGRAQTQLENGVDKQSRPVYKTVRAAEHWLRDYEPVNLVRGLAFLPGPIGTEAERYIYKNGERLLNLWSGWGATPVRNDELVKPYLQLIDHLFLGEPNAEPDKTRRKLYRQYYLSALAYPLQHPGAKIEQAIASVGRPGSGKTLPFSLYGELHGAGFVTIGESELESNFNSLIAGRTSILGEEITGEGQSRKHANKLKHMVTGEQIWIEKKYVDKYRVDNLANYLFTSNDRDAFFLGFQDRRFFVFDTPDKKLVDALSVEKVKHLDEIFRRDPNALNALMYYFTTFSIDEGVYRPAGLEPPATPAKTFMEDQSRSEAEIWIRKFIASERINPITKQNRTLFRSEELLAEFHAADSKNKKCGEKAFTNAMADYFWKPLGPDFSVRDCWVRDSKAYPSSEPFFTKMKPRLWALKGEHTDLNESKARAIWNKENHDAQK